MLSADVSLPIFLTRYPKEPWLVNEAIKLFDLVSVIMCVTMIESYFRRRGGGGVGSSAILTFVWWFCNPSGRTARVVPEISKNSNCWNYFTNF